MKYQLVLFDLDGTLINTIDDLREAVNHAMTLRGFPTYTRDEVMTMVGHGIRNLVINALPSQYKDDTAMVEAALADFTAYYKAHIDVHTRPYPGMQALTERLHQESVFMAVASNKFQEGTEYLVKKFFPEIPFVAVLGNRPGYPLKPDPEIVGEVLRKAGVSREAAVMVGDSPTDMKTAENGGIRGIAVSWGYRDMKDLANSSALRQAQGPQDLMVVKSAEELQKLLLS
ncbi:MAG: HAD-IA family hydrolase [Bacteroidales bacterium]|nr:HAD-IA family hydrolase [Bacteroidales bacterium]